MLTQWIQQIKRFKLLLLFFTMMPPGGQAQPLTFDHITIKDGLSNNTIYAITQDQDGIMWFGSRDGLNRYDGYEFKVYKSDPADSTTISSNHIQELFCHPNGDIWIGLVKGGLSIFDRKTQRFIVNPFKEHIFEDWMELSIVSIFQDSKKNIWLATLDAGVVCVDSTLQAFQYFGINTEDGQGRISNNTCFSFAEDAQSNIWMGTSGNSINYWSPVEKKVFQVAPSVNDAVAVDLSSFRKKLFVKDADQLWVGTEGNGLYQYSLSQKRFVGKALDHSLIRDIAPLKASILISTDGEGLYQSSDQGRTFQNYKTSSILINSLNTNAIYDIFVDQLGQYQQQCDHYHRRRIKWSHMDRYIYARLQSVPSPHPNVHPICPQPRQYQ